MQNTLEMEIRNQLIAYLAGRQSLEQFRDWFDSSTWDIEESGSPATVELASEIELRLAEFSNGHWTEEELREQLKPLVEVRVK